MTDIEIRKLINPKEFVNAWFRMLPHHKTYEDAYEALEVHFEGYFGRRKYSDYRSFRVIKDRMKR
jgi:hypothetical protein